MKHFSARQIPVYLLIFVLIASCGRAGRKTPAPVPTGVQITPQATAAPSELPQATQGPVAQASSTPLPATGDGGPMQLVQIANAKARGAVCNDGSAGSYYIRRSPGSKLWSIHLQGGGFCSSVEDCKNRQGNLSSLMTSDQQQPGRPGNGIFSTSASANPGFAGANMVYVHYCSSDLWSGNRDASAETDNLYFHGEAIFQALIADLSDPSITAAPNLSQATQVLLSGSSAGGLGVLVNLDWLAGKLPGASVKGVADAGWFLDIQPFDPSVPPPTQLVQTAYTFWKGTVDQSCAAANPGAEGKCYMGQYVYPEIKTPLFIQEAQYDQVQLALLGLKLPITQAERAYAVKFGDAMRQSLASVKDLFSPAARTHGLLTRPQYSTEKIQGETLAQALKDWFFDGKDVQLIGQGPVPIK